MHRYEELEKVYYKKLYLKIFTGFILFVLFIILLFIFLDSGKKSAKPVKPETKQIQKSQKTVKAENKDINKTKQKTDVKKHDMQKKQEIKKEDELKFILPNIDFIKEPSEPKQQIKKPVEKKEQKPVKTQTIPQNIKITENKVNIKDLINEFKGNKDYNLAITIANIYLKRNDLKNAQIWALNANSLAPSKPESWIIFADIMIKKHNIKKAKDLLKVYIDSYGSNDIIEEKLRSINGK